MRHFRRLKMRIEGDSGWNNVASIPNASTSISMEKLCAKTEALRGVISQNQSEKTLGDWEFDPSGRSLRNGEVYLLL